ncbi:PA2779 family protein [Magnetospirillum sp. UT-4]|uniref:PA2779 family protein n=1 Tax=Magnetospirillum sp. UT-4 TaxID=2681467 RepID=UPI0013819F4F|nr:PA2779 family protein [Magnetospirillum sp. UT-4]CAA7616009.1 conserved exported hypothetical protein [Magnetospirillum sp. UT-4]
MAEFRPCRHAVAAVTVLALVLASVPVPAGARLVATDTVLAAEQRDGDRERVAAFLARDDVRAQMQALGVSPDEAERRVEAMSDEEIARIAGNLDTLPAGGNGLGVVIGAAVLVFIILLITDIAGLTKVFPWTRSVR